MQSELKREAMLRFTEAWHRIENLYDVYAKSQGMNFTAILVLEYLSSPGEIYTQKALCEKLSLPKQTVNVIVNSFREQGYVQLTEAKDRRNKELALTDEGKKYAEKISGHFQTMEAKTWECFAENELLAFVETTEKYEKSLANVVSQFL